MGKRGCTRSQACLSPGEFGRTPMGEVREFTGRNHHIDAFTGDRMGEYAALHGEGVIRDDDTGNGRHAIVVSLQGGAVDIR